MFGELENVELRDVPGWVRSYVRVTLKKLLDTEGYRGRRGRRGGRGLLGERGEIGPGGQLGERGEIGATGPAGALGSAGAPGAPGDRGKRGYKGVHGRAGEVGLVGPPGPKGDTGPAPEHQWQGNALRFRKPNGDWGTLTNLQGPGGRAGGRGGSAAKEQFLDIALNGNVLEFRKEGALGPDKSVDLSAIATGEELLAQQIDEESGGDLLYIGEAAPGTLTSAALWRIKRITFTLDGDGDTDGVTEWADGASAQDQIWDDHLTLSYS